MINAFSTLHWDDIKLFYNQIKFKIITTNKCKHKGTADT